MNKAKPSKKITRLLSLLMTLVMLLTGFGFCAGIDSFADDSLPGEGGSESVTEEETFTEEPAAETGAAQESGTETEGEQSGTGQEQGDPEPDPVICFKGKPVQSPDYLNSAECIAMEDPVEIPISCSEPLGYVLEGNELSKQCIEVLDGGKYVKGLKHGGCAVRYYVIGHEDIYAKVFVSVRQERQDQTIEGPDTIEGNVGETISVKDHYTSSTVPLCDYGDNNGDFGVYSTTPQCNTITFRKAGTATATIVANSTPYYRRAEKTITIIVKDPEGEARAAAAKKAAALKKPTLKIKRYKRKNKLTWSKVPGAAGYQIFIRYPGQKSYKWALSKGASVKSVTHKGLKRKKYYSYKVRPYIKYGGKVYYGPFSKAVTVKVK